MSLETITKVDWTSFTQDFAEQHRSWIATLELHVPSLSEGDVELTTLEHEAPLVDLAFEARGGEEDRLILTFGHEPGETTTHVLRGVSRLQVVKQEPAEVDLRVMTSNREATHLRLRMPAG